MTCNLPTNDLTNSRCLSVIVPVFRAATGVEACLGSLRSSISHSDEIILVVDGAGHDSLKWEDGMRILTLELELNSRPVRDIIRRDARRN
jgi:hypothetical protein